MSYVNNVGFHVTNLAILPRGKTWAVQTEWKEETSTYVRLLSTTFPSLSLPHPYTSIHPPSHLPSHAPTPSSSLPLHLMHVLVCVGLLCSHVCAVRACCTWDWVSALHWWGPLAQNKCFHQMCTRYSSAFRSTESSFIYKFCTYNNGYYITSALLQLIDWALPLAIENWFMEGNCCNRLNRAPLFCTSVTCGMMILGAWLTGWKQFRTLQCGRPPSISTSLGLSPTGSSKRILLNAPSRKGK